MRSRTKTNPFGVGLPVLLLIPFLYASRSCFNRARFNMEAWDSPSRNSSSPTRDKNLSTATWNDTSASVIHYARIHCCSNSPHASLLQILYVILLLNSHMKLVHWTLYVTNYMPNALLHQSERQLVKEWLPNALCFKQKVCFIINGK